MTVPRLSRIGAGLALLCLVGLGAAPVPAAADPPAGPAAVVLASTAAGYVAGDPVDGRVRVPDGASLVLLLATGRLIEIDGFYDGPVEGLVDGPGAAGEARRDGLRHAGSVDESTLGGARGLDGSAGPAGEVAVDAGTAVPICRIGGHWPALRRGAGLDGPLRLTVGAAAIEWPAGQDRLVLPPDPAIADTATAAPAAAGPFDLRDAAGHIVARAVPRGHAAADDGPAGVLAALAAAGCRQQAGALAARLREAAVGLDLAITSDRGRDPRYRIGEPIRLTVRVNRPSHVHCLVRTADGVVPIHPPAAVSDPVTPESAVDIPGDAFPMRLAASAPAGATEVRCVAVLPPRVAALPVAQAPPAPLPAARAAAMERALAALPMSRWAADTLSVEVVD